MAKKSSKATTPSWRTLMRRAKDEDKAGKPKVAASLRAKAADMRKGTRGKKKPASTPRSEALKKAWATRRANAFSGTTSEQSREYAKVLRQADNQSDTPNRGFSTVTGVDGGAPGRGEIIGGAEHQFAEEIAKLARKKGGKDAIQNLITERIAIARAEGARLVQRDVADKLIAQRKRIDEQIVCGWVTEVLDMKRYDGGALDENSTLMVAPHIVERLLNALTEAGYTPTGRRS